MFRNYVKIALRSLRKNPLYTTINVVGLALGMACSLLIGLWVRNELSYDQSLRDASSVYFVRYNSTFNGDVFTSEGTPGPLSDAIQKDVPEVAHVVKLSTWPEMLIKVDGKAAKEHGYYATDDFFGVFDLPAVSGDPKAALAQPDKIVITRRIAEKFFPNGLAIGKSLQFDNDRHYTVGAVIEDLPANSTLQFDWLINFKVQEEDWMKTWGNTGFYTYVKLQPHTTAAQTGAVMKGIYPRYAKDNVTYPILQPITDQHLYSDYKNGKVVGGRIEYVRIFSVVALFILLIACINFMNLATARSAMRAKEVGVRKVVGALRSSLIGQFMSESMLTSLLAVGVALVIVWLVLPTFNAVFEKHLVIHITDPTLWISILVLVLLTGFVAGSYPALFLSALQPIKILKGGLGFGGPKIGGNAALLRRGLVVFQFMLSAFLIIGMLAVGRQMSYIRTKNLGLNRENVVYIPLEGSLGNPAFRQEVAQSPSIVSTTTTMSLPVDVQGTSGDLSWPGKNPTLQTSVAAMFVGSGFTKTMNIQMADGRDFSADSPADSGRYVINEATARLMGMKNPVGQEVQFWRGKGRIVGVMKDFHLNSLHQAILPLVLCYSDKYNSSYLLVKTRAGQTPQALADLERITKQFNPNYPFEYHFLDEAYEKLYNSEQQIHTLVNYFGMLAIVISCLGLFALAAFTAEQRTKEIGVRKVLGASVTNIVTLLSQDFLKLVFIALLLASPLAWWALSKWFDTFRYHTELSWWLFGAAGLLAVGIALLTISFQSIKAALMNPVKSLRAE